MNAQQAAIDFIRREKESILTRWMERAEEEGRAAKRAAELVLRDHVPVMLENLAGALESTGPELDPREAGKKGVELRISREHGASRARTDAYTVGQVLHEFAILRHVLTDALHDEGLAEFGILETINRLTELTALETAVAFMNAIQERQNDMLGSLAHDIRNQLFVASGNIFLLNSAKPEDVPLLIQRLQGSVDNALRMLEGILDSASVEAGHAIGLNFEELDLRELVEQAGEEKRSEAPDRVRLELPSKPIHGTFDAESIRRLVENLLSNALKYGTKSTPVNLSLEDHGSYCLIRVQNEGPPIPEEDRKTIFEFFKRGQGQAPSGRRSWGLGLAFVRLVAEAHNGEVTLESSEEEGTRFSVKLSREGAR